MNCDVSTYDKHFFFFNTLIFIWPDRPLLYPAHRGLSWCSLRPVRAWLRLSDGFNIPDDTWWNLIPWNMSHKSNLHYDLKLLFSCHGCENRQNPCIIRHWLNVIIYSAVNVLIQLTSCTNYVCCRATFSSFNQ